MNPKKILAPVATVALVAALSSTAAFAADYDGTNFVTTDTTLNIPKTLMVSNENGMLTSVAGPGLTYSYTIAPETPSAANGGTTITDKESPAHTGVVHAGPADGVTLTTSSVSWGVSEALNASQAGTANTKNIVASVDLSEFGTQAGIYRYKITESNADSLAGGRVLDADAAEVRYLDVYIERDQTDALAVKGYVVHTGATSENAPSQKKTFDSSTFNTYNVKLTKQVEGNMGDRGNEFGFAGAVIDNGRYIYAKENANPSSTAANDADKIAAASTGTLSVDLKHNDYYVIGGLSKKATVSYTETNNTTDVYQVAISGATGDATSANSAASAVNASATKQMAATEVGDADGLANMTFTNTLESVSPTGVVMRYGAALAVLLAAIGLVVINKRSKNALNK